MAAVRRSLTLDGVFAFGGFVGLPMHAIVLSRPA
jgi:hypothetical protein